MHVSITDNHAAELTWWQKRNIAWVQGAFKEINDWNTVQANQPIQALCLFRWHDAPVGPESWSISNRGAFHDNFRAAMQDNYHVRWVQVLSPPPPTIEQAVQTAALAHRWMPIKDQAALYR